MDSILSELGKIGIIPVIKIDNADKAVPLAMALKTGGIPCAEVTFRTAQAEEAMRRISREVPEMLLGAGTVLTTEQVDKAIDSGAKYIVSPGFNPKVVSHCIGKGIAVTPGCSTPSDIEQALEYGLDVVKFFPAEQAGGLDYIKAVSAPYGTVSFIPTGGINAQNIAKYIAFDRVLACGGSWMAPPDLINAGEFLQIFDLCQKAMFSLLGFGVSHIGINAEGEEAARNAANFFSNLFGFDKRAGEPSSVFAGDNIEVLKQPCQGKNGHIAIETNSAFRAKAYFERFGIDFLAEGAKADAKGSLTEVYFKDKIGGFAVHLIQKK